MDKYQLSMPGPTECDPEVLNELNRPNLPHYGDLWVHFYLKMLDKLKKIYQTNGDVFIIPSSGSGGLESAFASFAGGKVLILNNGDFGKKLFVIASHHMGEIIEIKKEHGEQFDVEEIQKYVRKDKFDLLAIVHGETGTGQLNPLCEIAKLCKKNNILFIVDAISTLGGAELSVDSLGIDICISASQKSLGSIPGLATVSVSDDAWRKMPREEDLKSWYFNLRTWQRYFTESMDWHPSPMTLPVHLFFALNKSFDIILAEGLEKVWLRHKKVANNLRASLENLGIFHYLRNKECDLLPTVTTAVLPDGVLSKDLQRYLVEKHSIVIASGVGELKEKVFRVGHMAYSANDFLTNRVVSGIKSYLEFKTINKKN